eukprot:Cvel_21583.t1-p1 / transcript=Cvel_21583.t1 / gene=Cvel_21583 / organism=Chromera_velia_CCMP2878 / gene_product=hypothetical protein / transcript_product=hypothetical protein / location=Cvel_scaffold2037:18628-19668(+) / protein_length=347 / sequence_SO=supercontig / SO=protein_coding / is_pseudo=false
MRKVVHSAENRDERGGTWIEALVGPIGGEMMSVGELRFPDDPLAFQPRFASFIEVYGDPKTCPSSTPAVKISFSNPRINGKPLSLADFEELSAHHPLDVPQQAETSLSLLPCPSSSECPHATVQLRLSSNPAPRSTSSSNERLSPFEAASELEPPNLPKLSPVITTYISPGEAPRPSNFSGRVSLLKAALSQQTLQQKRSPRCPPCGSPLPVDSVAAFCGGVRCSQPGKQCAASDGFPLPSAACPWNSLGSGSSLCGWHLRGVCPLCLTARQPGRQGPFCLGDCCGWSQCQARASGSQAADSAGGCQRTVWALPAREGGVFAAEGFRCLLKCESGERFCVAHISAIS